MSEDQAKQAAQEYLALKMSEEFDAREAKLNKEAAIALAPAVWRKVSALVVAKCKEWNSVTNEETLTCKETILGDLRISCAGRKQQMTVHYDFPKLLITIVNTARLEHETDVLLHIEGYSTGSGRDAQLVRSGQVVNIDLLIVGELRVLVGMARQTHP
jgi:hypothetical protein